MLSYRHEFHAGNFADVLKHSVLVWILDYMKHKHKAFSYFDTHAGAGVYRLSGKSAQQTGEYKEGIEPLATLPDPPQFLVSYLESVKDINPLGSLVLYPGSVALAKNALRKQDCAHVFELHPKDQQFLSQYCQSWNKCYVHKQDGYKGLLSLLPPPSKRGVILIDPPYEIKNDYQIAIKTLIQSYRKFATGCYILWYPVVDRRHVDSMKNDLINSSIKNILQIEFCKEADTHKFGMTGSGLFIINPPWELSSKIQKVLPCLLTTLGRKTGFYTVEQLVAE